mgnify:CR=1 FL=1
MDFLVFVEIILLGIVEGITEWLPISSTGHMNLITNFWELKKVSPAFTEMFEYVIQLAAILAVVVYFFQKLLPFRVEKDTSENIEEGTKTKLVADMGALKLWLKVIIACVPAVFALVIDKLFEGLAPTTESLIIACALIFYGVIFIVVENFNKKRNPKIHEISELSYKYAFFIGCFQVLAVIPGTSRSGITIIGALLLGISRTAATEFTFFLAIPTMVGASAYKLLKFFLEAGSMSGAEVGYLLIGSVVAFAVSLVVIKMLTNFVKKHDFKPFGWYRIGFGFVVILALVLPALL